MYCFSSKQWIWMADDSTRNPSGNWGVKGVSNPSNKPNGRAGGIGWTDKKGHLYTFGGSGTPFATVYNDLWKFTIDTACGGCAISCTPPQIELTPNSYICKDSTLQLIALSAGATAFSWSPATGLNNAGIYSKLL